MKTLIAPPIKQPSKQFSLEAIAPLDDKVLTATQMCELCGINEAECSAFVCMDCYASSLIEFDDGVNF